MRIKLAAEKQGVPRYQIDYWRKTGLLSSSSDALNFEDLLKLKFIVECKQKKLSLQKIRHFLELGMYEDEKQGQRRWRNNVRVVGAGNVALENGGELVQPETGQIFFNYNGDAAESADSGRVLNLATGAEEAPEILDPKMQDLEDRFQEALSSMDDEKIKETLFEILELEPDHIGALIEFGNLAFENKQFDDAIEYYEKALGLNPECVEAAYNLANLYFRGKKYAVAIRYYQMSMALDPDFPEAYYNLALVYYSLSYLDRARDLFEMYLSIDPGSTWCDQARQFLEEIAQVMSEEKTSALQETGPLFPE